MEQTQFAGRTALVTGSSRGIGRAIALRLGALGADVAVNYVTNAHAAQKVVDQLHAFGRRACAISADVSRPEELARLFDQVADAWQTLDIYVNNAIDVASFGPVVSVRPDAWRHTVDSHVATFLQGSQRAAALMHGRAGVIVGMSSLGARTYLPGYSAIGVGKAAVEALTRYLAVELGPVGIRVNTVCPGPIDTEGLRRFATFDRIRDAAIQHAPARRIGLPDDVADVVAFLCSDQARYIYGQTLVVDGGLSLLGAR
jgi:NAD(P)-dependent dehydrogenase (short-subunit alcohol dehydrogenase family)